MTSRTEQEEAGTEPGAHDDAEETTQHSLLQGFCSDSEGDESFQAVTDDEKSDIHSDEDSDTAEGQESGVRAIPRALDVSDDDLSSNREFNESEDVAMPDSDTEMDEELFMTSEQEGREEEEEDEDKEDDSDTESGDEDDKKDERSSPSVVEGDDDANTDSVDLTLTSPARKRRRVSFGRSSIDRSEPIRARCRPGSLRI